MTEQSFLKMPTYRRKPVEVVALRIEEIRSSPNWESRLTSRYFLVFEGDYGMHEVPGRWMNYFKPEVGGYFVVNQYGVETYLSKATLENEYQLEEK